MTEPTKEEYAILDEFRPKVNDILENEYMRSDPFLLKWLRARDLKIDAAEKMLRTSIEWRKTTGMDSILTEVQPEYLTTEYAYEFHGHDKGHRPNLIIPLGKWDLRKIIDNGNQDEFLRYMDQMLEKIDSRVRKSKPLKGDYPITQFTVLFDMTDYSFRQVANIRAPELIMQAVAHYEAHFPEMLFAAVVVNAPWYFSILFAIVKRVMSSRTFQKVTIHGYNKEQWGADLLERIDADQLPIRLGGTAENNPEE